MSAGKSETNVTNENIGAGALGGAAVGAVAALGVASGGVFVPLIASAVGAAVGAGVGRLASSYVKVNESDDSK